MEDFLITDRKAVNRMQPNAQAADSPEQLLVHQDGEWLSMALFIEPEVLDRLNSHDPLQALHTENITQFCIALEGVSHFLYLAWRAGFDRAVSLLELELQAEIDKYVSLAGLLARQRADGMPADLMRCLFDAVGFDASLDAVASRRYRAANAYARRYCMRLQERYRGRILKTEMLRELRRFYRLSQSAKICRIDAAAH